MTAPRQVLPGRIHLITRRTSDRRFFLRPDKELNNTFLYCLALVAERHRIKVLGFVVLSDHYHAVIYDEHGTVNHFSTDFHALVARSVNALRGRTGHFWDNRIPSVVDLLTVETVIEKLVYVMSNPVKHDLVEKAASWPGLSTFAAMSRNQTMEATRPTHFFAAESALPEKVTLSLELPALLGSRVVRAITLAVRHVETQRATLRRRAGRRVVGRVRILGAPWSARARSRTTFRAVSPRFASRDIRARIEAIEKRRAFVLEYRHARELWLAGLEAVFPAGTYWLQRFVGVPTEPAHAA